MEAQQKNGWLKLHRNVLDTSLLKNPNLWTFFTFLLLQASYSEEVVDVGRQSVRLRPGELILTRRMASESLGFSSQTVRTCLAALQEQGTISCKATNKYTVIFIVNWDTYQLGYSQDNQQNEKVTNKSTNKSRKINQQINQQKNEDLQVKSLVCTDDQHREQPTNQPTKVEKSTSKTTSLRRSINKEVKEGEEGEEVGPPLDSDFSAFWNAYPRKVNKMAALRAWQATDGKRPTIEHLLTAVRAQANTAQWRDNDGAYIPAPARWLYDRRWEDGALVSIAPPALCRKWGTGASVQIGEITYVLDEYGDWNAQNRRGTIPGNMMSIMIASGKAEVLDTNKVLH